MSEVMEVILNLRPYPNALDMVKCNIHGILTFRKAEGGETGKKILFASEIIQLRTFAQNFHLKPARM
jgi:hypothetical protein